MHHFITGQHGRDAFVIIPGWNAPARTILMTTQTIPGESLSPERREAIERAVKKMAWEHLRAEDAETALGYYEPDALVASDGRLYPSFEVFAGEIREFYRTLETVHVAEWEEMVVNALGPRLALLTAKVRWSSTDTSGVTTTLYGVWSALLVEREGRWQIRARHESFVHPLEGTTS